MNRFFFLVASIALAAAACSSAAEDSSCGGILVIDGAVYLPDAGNDDRLDESDLGPKISTVNEEWPCESGNAAELDSGTYALGLPVGSEVHPVTGYPSANIVAAMATDQTVNVYRSEHEDPLLTVQQLNVTAIVVNDELGGLATLATIEDQETVSALVAATARTPLLSDESTTTGQRYFIEFVHGDLVTVVPFWTETGRLGNHAVGPEWADEVSSALSE